MDFRFKEDTEGTAANNNGHVVHRLEAHMEGETGDEHGGMEGDEIAYINVTYVPSETWENDYSGDWGLLRFADHYRGWCGFLHCEAFDDKSGFKPLSEVVRSLSRKVIRRSERPSREECQNMNRDELEVRFDHYIEKAWEELEEDWESAKQFHVDKPRVEYIYVSEDFRRQGIATKLYKRMATELERRYGLHLHSSTVQRDEAEAAWEKLITLDWNDHEEEFIPFPGSGKVRYKLSVNPGTKQPA